MFPNLWKVKNSENTETYYYMVCWIVSSWRFWQIKNWSRRKKAPCKTHQSDYGPSQEQYFILILSDNRRSIELTLEQKNPKETPINFRCLDQQFSCDLSECYTSEPSHLSCFYLDFELSFNISVVQRCISGTHTLIVFYLCAWLVSECLNVLKCRWQCFLCFHELWWEVYTSIHCHYCSLLPSCGVVYLNRAQMSDYTYGISTVVQGGSIHNALPLWPKLKVYSLFLITVPLALEQLELVLFRTKKMLFRLHCLTCKGLKSRGCWILLLCSWWNGHAWLAGWWGGGLWFTCYYI